MTRVFDGMTDRRATTTHDADGERNVAGVGRNTETRGEAVDRRTDRQTDRQRRTDSENGKSASERTEEGGRERLRALAGRQAGGPG